MLQLLLLKRVVLQNKKAGNIFVRRRPIQLYNNEWLFTSNDPEKKNLNLEIFSRTLLSIYQLTRYMAETYMAILLEETLTYISKD
jgi:hypothetical protein